MPDETTPISEPIAPVETVVEPVAPTEVVTEPTAEPTLDAEADISVEEIQAAAQAFLSQFGGDPVVEPAPQPTLTAPVVVQEPIPTDVTFSGQYVSRLDQLEATLKEAWNGYEYGAPASEVAILDFLKEQKEIFAGLESRVDGAQSAVSPFVEQQRQVAATRLVDVTSQAAEQIKAAYPNAPVDVPSLLRMVGSKFDAYAQVAGISGDLTSIEAGVVKDMFEMTMRPHLSKFSTTPKAAGARPDAIASGSAPVSPSGLTREELIAQDLALANQR